MDGPEATRPPSGAAEEDAGNGPRKGPEILAPAGTEEAFAAALASRADAVYLGLAEGFHARGRSTAFSLESLPGYVRRAHAANAKLYLTLNTLVFESELESLEGLLRSAVEAGVDALIVQDPATALLARRISPEVRLHASTQMTISSAEGALFAATLGMERVVLPRELSTGEIARFTKESPLEAEVFVHGALCMAWSGQCLTSEAFSERSANRGQCSQACRMPYEAIVDGEKRVLGDLRYLLSPQDLAGHEALPELLEAGVHSLKIEGRYKGPAYVATAVDSYRNWRDALLRGATADDRTRLHRDVEKTQLTFSRGASPGFLRGDNHQALVVATTPKHRGLPLGVVREVRARSVVVERSASHGVESLLRPGVGVKFEPLGRSGREHDPENVPGGPVFGVRVLPRDAVELSFGQPGPDLSKVRVGDEVRLTGDPEIGRDVARRLSQAPTGRLPLELRVEGRRGQSLVVEAVATFGNRRFRASARSEGVLDSAQVGGGLHPDLLAEKLGALGGTPFHLASLDGKELEPGLHLPVSELKALRREVVRRLQTDLERPKKLGTDVGAALRGVREELAAPASDLDVAPSVVPLVRTEEQLDALVALGLGEGAEVELDWMEMVGLTRAVRRAKDAGLRVTLATVRVQKPGEEAYDRRLANLTPNGVLVRHWGALMHFARARGSSASRQDFAIHGDFSLNVTNSLTARHLLGLGLDTVTASHDLNQGQLLAMLERVPRGRVSITLHHHIPTFHNSHCVYAHLLSDGADYRTCGRPCEEHRIALRDYAGHEHPMVVDVGCRNTMFNAFAQSAAPLVPRLLDLGVRRFRVEFVWESGGDVTRTMEAYRRLLTGEIEPKEALAAARVNERYGVTTPLQIRRK